MLLPESSNNYPRDYSTLIEQPRFLRLKDLGEEDVVGLVRGFEEVAADGGVGRAQVAWFPGLVQCLFLREPFRTTK